MTGTALRSRVRSRLKWWGENPYSSLNALAYSGGFGLTAAIAGYGVSWLTSAVLPVWPVRIAVMAAVVIVAVLEAEPLRRRLTQRSLS